VGVNIEMSVYSYAHDGYHSGDRFVGLVQYIHMKSSNKWDYLWYYVLKDLKGLKLVFEITFEQIVP